MLQTSRQAEQLPIKRVFKFGYKNWLKSKEVQNTYIYVMCDLGTVLYWMDVVQVKAGSKTLNKDP